MTGLLAVAWGLVLGAVPAWSPAGAAPVSSAPIKVLVVGRLENERLLATDASLAGATRALQIRAGHPLIDAYRLAQLRRYSVVYLYGFGAHDPLAASALLSAFVDRGGHLVVDVPGDATLANQLALGAPGLFPATNWTPATISKHWSLHIASSALGAGLAPSFFSPPVYRRRLGWGVAVSHTLGRGATVAITCAAGPIVVTGRSGRGTVVMSGMNLTYHAAVFENPREAALVVRMLTGS